MSLDHKYHHVKDKAAPAFLVPKTGMFRSSEHNDNRIPTELATQLQRYNLQRPIQAKVFRADHKEPPSPSAAKSTAPLPKLVREIKEAVTLTSDGQTKDINLLKMRVHSYALGAILAFDNWINAYASTITPEQRDQYFSAIDFATNKLINTWRKSYGQEKGALSKGQWKKAIGDLTHFLDVLAAIPYPCLTNLEGRPISSPSRKEIERAIVKGESYLRWEIPRPIIETTADITLPRSDEKKDTAEAKRSESKYRLSLQTTPVLHITEDLQKEWLRIFTPAEMSKDSALMRTEQKLQGSLPTSASQSFISVKSEKDSAAYIAPVWFQKLPAWEQAYLKAKVKLACRQEDWTALMQTKSATERTTPGLANFVYYENTLAAEDGTKLSLPSLGYSTFSPIDVKDDAQQLQICRLNMWQLLEYMGFQKQESRELDNVPGVANKINFKFTEEKQAAAGTQTDIKFSIPVETSSYLTPSPVSSKDLRMYKLKCQAIDEVRFQPTTRTISDGKAVTLEAKFLYSNYPINGGRPALDSTARERNRIEASKLVQGTFTNLQSLLKLAGEESKDGDLQHPITLLGNILAQLNDVTRLKKNLPNVLSNINNLINQANTPGSILAKTFAAEHTQLKFLLHLLHDYIKLSNRNSFWGNKRHRQLMLAAQHSLIVTFSLQLLGSKSVLNENEKSHLLASGHCQSDKDRHGEVRQTMVAMAQYFMHFEQTPHYDDPSVAWAQFDEIYGRIEKTRHTKEMAGESSFGCSGLKDSPSPGVLGVATLSDRPPHFSPFASLDKREQESSWAAADTNRLKAGKWRKWKLLSWGLNKTSAIKLLLLGLVLTVLLALPVIGQIVALGATVALVLGIIGAAIAPKCHLKRIEGFILGVILGTALIALPFIGPVAAFALACAFVGACIGAAIGRYRGWTYSKTVLFALATGVGSGLLAGFLLPVLAVGASWLASCAGLGTAVGFIWGVITGRSIVKSMLVGAAMGVTAGLFGYFSVFSVEALIPAILKPVAIWMHQAISLISEGIATVFGAVFVGKTVQAHWQGRAIDKEAQALLPAHGLMEPLITSGRSHSYGSVLSGSFSVETPKATAPAPGSPTPGCCPSFCS